MWSINVVVEWVPKTNVCLISTRFEPQFGYFKFLRGSFWSRSHCSLTFCSEIISAITGLEECCDKKGLEGKQDKKGMSFVLESCLVHYLVCSVNLIYIIVSPTSFFAFKQCNWNSLSYRFFFFLFPTFWQVRSSPESEYFLGSTI